MKNNQKGFANLVVIGAMLVAVIVGSSYYLIKKRDNPKQSNQALNSIVSQPNTHEVVTLEDISDWKVYKDLDWGFELKYPKNYYFFPSKTVLNGIPNTGHIFQIRSTTATSSINKTFDATVSIMTSVKKPQDLIDSVDSLVSSAQVEYKKNGISVTKDVYDIHNEQVPIVTMSSPTSSIKIAYISRPPLVYTFAITPKDDATLNTLLSTISFESITPTASTTNTNIFYNQAALRFDKDPYWCKKLLRVEEQDQCLIGLRGNPIYDTMPVDFSIIPKSSGGVGGAVSGTNLMIDGKKGSKVWLAGGITTAKDVNILEFDAEIINGEKAQSLLTVYLDSNTEIGIIDGRVAEKKDHYVFPMFLKNNIGANPYSPNYIKPGVYVLGFRLDSFAEGSTSVKISNIKVGLAH